MTIEEAERVRQLLNTREKLVSDLERVEVCDAINGSISYRSDVRRVSGSYTWGNAGYGFAPEPCREIKYLIDGYKADIAKIDALLESLASPNFPET